MLACIQRVSHAEVCVANQSMGRIDRGLLVLLGVAAGDTQADARWLADKIVGLRIFDNSAGKMNLSLADVGGALLVVSQFTLLGDCRRGRRPSFAAAAPPELAESLYEEFLIAARAAGVQLASGRFGERMLVTLTNDGPVTLLLDTAQTH